jgi:hypothetical protein
MRTEFKRLLGASLAVAAWALPAPAGAAPLDGVTVSATGGGGLLWEVVDGSPHAIPAGYSFGLSGFPALQLSIDVTGLITVTASAQSCSTGCSFNLGPMTFDFTLDGSAPAILGLDNTLTDPDLGVTLSMVDADTFRMAVAGSASGIFTNVDVTTAQLDFAVPEPASMAALAAGLLGLTAIRRRRAH